MRRSSPARRRSPLRLNRPAGAPRRAATTASSAVQWRVQPRAGDYDAAAVADRDAAVAWREIRRQRATVRRTQPQPEQVPTALGFRPVHELGAVVKDLMVVHELNVARL